MTTQLQEPQQDEGRKELRERVVYPIAIPVVAILLTEIIVFSFSRIYLTAGHTGAAIIALAIAAGILVGASVIAARPRIKSSTIGGLLVVLAVVAVGAGAFAMQRGPYWGPEDPIPADLPRLEVASHNLDFDTDLIEISTAGAIIEYINDDTQPHNIAIFPSADELGDPMFRGEIIDGGERITYTIPALDAGTFYFHCDVHPAMAGDVVVE
jgi:plastocyanin